MSNNKSIYDMFATDEEKQCYLEADQLAENYMFSEAQFWSACVHAKFVPWLDMCCDTLGANSQTPYYYDAGDNSLLQELSSAELFCNPPFKNAEAFMRKCEEE